MAPIAFAASSSAGDGAPVTVHINSPSANATGGPRGKRWPSNYIRTTKYRWYTFVPLNLFWQFHRVSNIFFFLNMVIALIPGVSPVFPVTTILPLVAVLAVAMLRDGYEDFRRYRQDRAANALPVKVVSPAGAVVDRASADVQVGDVLFIERGHQIVADCVLLAAANADGAAFVETSNLDGETNLKPKQAKGPFQRACPDASAVARIAGSVTCDAPNNSLHKWQGRVALSGVPDEPVDVDHLLLRGCVVRNVDWVLAAVVYTGVNSKLFLNLTAAPPKQSRLDAKLNRLVALILAVQQVLILVLCGCGVAFATGTRVGTAGFYLRPVLSKHGGGMWFLLSYLTYFVLLSSFLPISLFVSLEFCKTVQALFMNWDLEMRDGRGRHAAARTSSLNEELSQVQYVFTDKTGTLTQNEMRFAKAFAGGKVIDELRNPGSLRAALGYAAPKAAAAGGGATVSNFLRLLALNNAVVINRGSDGAVEYDGSSPDEVALVTAAAAGGYGLRERTSDSMTVHAGHADTTFSVPIQLPFDADRKMMSVVVREADGTIRLYTKGADSSVLARCVAASSRERKHLADAQRFLDGCAADGLRTLALAERVFAPAEFEQWLAQWRAATLSVGADRGARVTAAALLAEARLRLVGCTAIEDRLQEEVPATIHFLLQAGIVVWVLTGDKRETAVNIARTSRLLCPEADHVMHLDAGLPAPVAEQLARCATQAGQCRLEGRRCSFVIDGRTFEAVLDSPELTAAFKALGLLVDSAVCCRVTPLQKASVVGMFQSAGATCLGVGDGANDVSMIQEARVGVGIMGLEGSQAERAADYAIPRFRCLRRLLAVHGRYSLLRNSSLVQYSFYKNLVFSLAHVYFAFWNGFSGQTIFDSWVVTLYNMLFTVLPPMVMGMFDIDLEAGFLLQHPALYRELRSPYAMRMSRVTAVVWVALAALHSWAGFYGTAWSCFRLGHGADAVYAGGGTGSARPGAATGLWFDGALLANTLLLMVNVQAALTFLSWTWVHVASIALSLIAYFVFLVGYGALPPSLPIASPTFHTVPQAVFSAPVAWLTPPMWCAAVVVPAVIAESLRRHLFGTDMHVARMAQAARKRGLPWLETGEKPRATIKQLAAIDDLDL